MRAPPACAGPPRCFARCGGEHPRGVSARARAGGRRRGAGCAAGGGRRAGGAPRSGARRDTRCGGWPTDRCRLSALRSMRAPAASSTSSSRPTATSRRAWPRPSARSCGRRGTRDRLFASSFDPAALRTVRALRPDIETALVLHAEDDVGAALREAARAGHRALHPEWRSVDRALVERARALGLAVRAWTVNDADELQRLARLGVDGLITDVPDVALAVLGPCSIHGPAPAPAPRRYPRTRARAARARPARSGRARRPAGRRRRAARGATS